MQKKSIEERVRKLEKMVWEIHSYNGKFDELCYYPNNEEFFELFNIDGITLYKSIIKRKYHIEYGYVKKTEDGFITSKCLGNYEEDLLFYEDKIIEEYLNYLQEINEL